MPFDGQSWVRGMGEHLGRGVMLPIGMFFQGNMLVQWLEGSMTPQRDEMGKNEV